MLYLGQILLRPNSTQAKLFSLTLVFCFGVQHLVCVCVCVFVCLCLCVWWGRPFRRNPSSGPPKISLFFPFSASNFVLFCSLWGLLVGLWTLFKAMDLSKCAFGPLWGHFVKPWRPLGPSDPTLRAPTLRPLPLFLGPPLFGPQKQIGLSRTWPK